MTPNPEDALGHWSTLVHGLQQPPIEFYESVEAAVARLNIPDAKFERVEYREGGVFSGFRQYLRVRRHRHVFDICAAPFGNGCFFSWWFAETRPQLPTIGAVLIVVVYLLTLQFVIREFGTFLGPLMFLLFIPLALFIGSRMGNPDTDDFILSLPLIGSLYDRFFRPITYYRVDTLHMFQKAVQGAVMEIVDQLTTAKGIRALSELERKPVMRDFIKK